MPLYVKMRNVLILAQADFRYFT